MPDFTALKAYAAFVGAIVSALLGVWAADSDVGKVLTVVSVLATAVVAYQVPKTLDGKHRAVD